MTTHAALIECAARWLARRGCAIVITDMSHGGSETADAIGWKGAVSTLIECKASRADFFADRHKCFRRMPERGMAGWRYYCVPAGLIKPDELPENWGLLEVTAKAVRESVKPEWIGNHSADAEISLLVSALRRVGHVCPRGVSVKVYTMDSLCRATLTVDPLEDWSV